VWGVQGYLDNVAATGQTYSGLKFDTNGVLESVYSATTVEKDDNGAGADTSYSGYNDQYNSHEGGECGRLDVPGEG